MKNKFLKLMLLCGILFVMTACGTNNVQDNLNDSDKESQSDMQEKEEGNIINASLSVSENKITIKEFKEHVVYFTVRCDGEFSLSCHQQSQCVRVNWGEWDGNTIPLYLDPLFDGTSYVTVSIKGTDISQKIRIDVAIQDSSSYTVNENNPNARINITSKQFPIIVDTHCATFTIENIIYSYEYSLAGSTSVVYSIKYSAEAKPEAWDDSAYIHLELYDEKGACVGSCGVDLDFSKTRQSEKMLCTDIYLSGNYELEVSD